METISTQQGGDFGGFASLLIVIDLSIWFELDGLSCSVSSSLDLNFPIEYYRFKQSYYSEMQCKKWGYNVLKNYSSPAPIVIQSHRKLLKLQYVEITLVKLWLELH